MQFTTEPQKYLCWPAERSKQWARAEEGWTCILSVLCRAQNCWSRLTSPCSPTATTPLCWMGQDEAFCRTKLKRIVRCLHQAFCSAAERVVWARTGHLWRFKSSNRSEKLHTSCHIQQWTLFKRSNCKCKSSSHVNINWLLTTRKPGSPTRSSALPSASQAPCPWLLQADLVNPTWSRMTLDESKSQKAQEARN